MEAIQFSVIICSIDAGKFARVSACYEQLLSHVTHEIIGIHDARSLAEGYNRGLARSTGKIVIFSHDDIQILDSDFAQKIQDRLSRYDLLGFAGTSRMIDWNWPAAGHPHLHGAVAHAVPGAPQLRFNVFGVRSWPVIEGIQAIDGLCMIANREVAESISFDAITFDGFHCYDVDFSFSAYLAGYRIAVNCDIPIIHESTGNFDNALTYAHRFLAKYENSLDLAAASAPKETDESCRPKGAQLSDHRTLLAYWRHDILARVTCSLPFLGAPST